MITTLRLPEVAVKKYKYGSTELCRPEPPIGVEEMPQEWQEKLDGMIFEPPYVYVLENVELAGPNLAGFLKDDLILDVGYYGRLDLWERNRPYFKWALECLQQPMKMVECAMSMASVWSGNYFHWLLDHLPTLEALAKYWEKTGEKPLVLLHNKPPKWITDSLDAFGVDYEIIENYHYLIGRLIVPTWPRRDGFIRPSAMEYLRNGDSQESRKLYISRSKAKIRRVINEDELRDTLIVHGFETVIMEDLDFCGQMQLMSQAGFVVGPHGAGLANIAMAKAECKTIELVMPTYTNPCCWLIQRDNYGFVMGEARGEDLRIDINKLSEVMEAMNHEEG